MLDGTSHVTTVRWLGVGGAEIESPRLPAGLGEVVWLAFELVVAGRPRTVVSTCRVSWIDRDRAHLSFVGLSDDMAVVSQAFEPTMAGPRPVVPTQDSSFAGASLRG